MELVTKEHIDLVREAGACRDALKSLKVGMPISSIKSNYLAWCEERFPDITAKIVAATLAATGVKQLGKVSIALLGYGDVSGYGYGSVSGSGFGYGYGSVSGSGSGSVSGSVSGSGFGSGFGYGYGYGYGR